MRLKVEELKNYIERFLALLVEIKNAISSTVATYFPTPVSDEWNSSTLYHKGDFCILNNYLYKCLVDNSNVRPPNTTYWILTNCGNEFSAINNNLEWIDVTNKLTFPTGYSSNCVLLYNALLREYWLIGSINGTIESSSGSYRIIANILSNVKPKYDTPCSCFVVNGMSNGYVSAGGSFVYTSSIASQKININARYKA